MRVLEVFDSLQGEGLWAGAPMTFVRLAGCNAPLEGLACVRWCDTPQSWDPESGREVEVEELAGQLGMPRVCLTGGEPLLQAEESVRFSRLLAKRGIALHLETNGTVALPAGVSFAWVTVSPKPPAYEVDSSFRARIDELKLIVDGEFDAEIGERLESEFPQAAISIQPEAEGGQDMVHSAVDMVLSHPHWRLSLQLHKLLGLP
ncbi:MAG TPA: 7-carboxy-7-deazaguanine synthase QueE [Thermoleophilia bacterium]|nr:7-carboxy-7-deazaguanine synthase QueE [Thermoleophilia bacterium]